MHSLRTSSRGPGSTSSTTSPSSRATHSWPFRTWCSRRTTPGRRRRSSATGCCGRSRTSRTISPGSRPTSWSPRSEHGAEAPDGGHVLMAVRSFEITRRSAVLDGRPFGATGAYEKIVGVFRFGIDPTHPANQAIADIGLAPRSAEGLVEAAADFYLLRPVDPARGKRRLLLDIPNRGRKVALGMFNSTIRVPDPTTAEDFGNGFLMRHGYTVAWCGWQHDVPRQDGLLALTVPVARGENGLIGGPVLCEWRPNSRVDTLPMADRYHIAQPTSDLTDPAARLTVRQHAGAPAAAIARTAWRFADATHVSLAGGFEPGKIYGLVYRAESPPLVGLGLRAVRDTAAWLRPGAAAAGNPAAGEPDDADVIEVARTDRARAHTPDSLPAQ